MAAKLSTVRKWENEFKCKLEYKIAHQKCLDSIALIIKRRNQG